MCCRSLSIKRPRKAAFHKVKESLVRAVSAVC
jgi:hypothetical protein